MSYSIQHSENKPVNLTSIIQKDNLATEEDDDEYN